MKPSRRYGRRTHLALSMWVKLARAYWTFAHHSHKDIERYTLTPPQFAVLEALGHLGRLTLGELSRKRLVTGGCMTLIVDNLEKEGFVERLRSTDDRRIVHVQLTTKGTKMFRAVFPPHADRITELASVLSEKEQLQLSALLRKIGLKLAALHDSDDRSPVTGRQPLL